MKSVFVFVTLFFAIICNVYGAPLETNEIVDVEPDRCLLPYRSGTASCRANILSWYYNNETGECEEFIYGGCGGNLNRFAAKQDCEAACSNVHVVEYSPIPYEKTRYNILNEIVDYRKLWK